ncbi:hypothetical protein ACLGI4_26205 [Streptomyces sp. HMX112]|uniref:hypothetical protein n=1 Tax=Streptomyces sp. HMX112 TaxID=3390850 RepID=UPI003A7F96AB
MRRPTAAAGRAGPLVDGAGDPLTGGCAFAPGGRERVEPAVGGFLLGRRTSGRDPRPFHGPAHDPSPPSHPGWCDGGPRGLLDLDTARRLTAEYAAAFRDEWAEHIRTRTPGPEASGRRRWVEGFTDEHCAAADAHLDVLPEDAYLPRVRFPS